MCLWNYFFFFLNSVLYYPLPHFVCSLEMFHNTVTSPFFTSWTLAVWLSLLNECCHMRISHFGPWSCKSLHTLPNPRACMCSFRNRSFQWLQGTGSRAKVFYISAALMTCLRTQWASHTKWWKRTKALWTAAVLRYLLDGFLMVGNWGKKGLMIQTGTLLIPFFFFPPRD